MVRAALHRHRLRDQRGSSRWRSQGRVHLLALGADAEPSRTDRAIQAARVSARGPGVLLARRRFALNDKPYRPNVGIALFNAAGGVLIGRRFRDDGPEIILPGLEWQMPQGGVDPGEDLREAVRRELWEETNVKDAEFLGETDWLTYDFPPYDGPPHRFGEFRGQRQKWFALRFTGNEADIDP